ncbi:PadR family transcriptional regulator [Streptosporangium sp. NPDC000396]|uniref:PadR family transcriptional regulator n=1 Tax=Streptosporangium sp. NPDC000396 TaxID=3366185 RepID=UPI003697747E
MSSTRALLLGVLLDGPLHGYEVRRRLELMGTHHWANVAYGSIYHGLGKMADEGLLERLEEGKGGKTLYSITETGRQEFMHNLLNHWWEIKPIVDPFQVAITFMDRLTPAELNTAIEARAAQLQFAIGMTERAIGGKAAYGAPRHIDECLRLNMLQLQAQLTWLGDAAEKIKNGDLP